MWEKNIVMQWLQGYKKCMHTQGLQSKIEKQTINSVT